MLFDGMSDDPVSAKKQKRKKPEPQPDEGRQEPVFDRPVIAERILGQTNGLHECMDESCLGGLHDIIEEYRGSWLLECVVCGTKQRAKAIKGYIQPRQDAFVFQAGDYAGMAVDAVWSDERGRGYVQWASEEHSDPAVRDACKKHLDSLQAAR